MKKIVLSLFLFTSLFSTVSCDKDFEEVNTDPNNPTKVPAHLMLGNIARVNQNAIYDMFVGGDMGMCWAQHVSKIQYNDEERYIPRQGSIDGLWEALYATCLFDAQSMYSLAEAEGNKSLQGIALVMQANSFQILTDVYGPIMFTQFNTGVFQPAYDSEDVVYNGINTMLKNAETLLAANVGTLPATSDPVYGGDVAKWRKFANSLRLKVLMRMSSKVNVAAEVAALAASGQLMTSNADSAQLAYKAAQPDANPIYETVSFGNRLEYKISSVLVSKLNSLSDPRLNIYGTPISGTVVGNVPGVENAGAVNSISGLGSFYLNPTLPGVFLSYAQVEFLLAEAANSGLIAGGPTTALVHYNKAITANMNFNGITNAAAIASYLAQPTVAFSTQVDGKQKIAEQTWLALFGQGLEAWTEWRRTGFPALSPVFDANTTSIPKRFFYASDEISKNSANFNAAVAMLNGGDELTSPVWWME